MIVKSIDFLQNHWCKKKVYLAVLEGEVWEEDLVAEVLVGDQEGGLVEDLGADLVVVPEAIDEAVDP